MIKRGRVIRIFDDEKIAINLGVADGAVDGKNVTVYAPPIEIEDPETEESLGEYRYRKASGKIIAISDRFAIIGPYPRHEESASRGTQSFLGLLKPQTVTKKVRGRFPIHQSEASPIPTGNEIRIGDTVEIDVEVVSEDQPPEEVQEPAT